MPSRKFTTHLMALWPPMDSPSLLEIISFIICMKERGNPTICHPNIFLPSSKQHCKLWICNIVVTRKNLMITKPKFYSFTPLLRIISEIKFIIIITILKMRHWRSSRIFHGYFDSNPPKKPIACYVEGQASGCTNISCEGGGDAVRPSNIRSYCSHYQSCDCSCSDHKHDGSSPNLAMNVI